MRLLLHFVGVTMVAPSSWSRCLLSPSPLVPSFHSILLPGHSSSLGQFGWMGWSRQCPLSAPVLADLVQLPWPQPEGKPGVISTSLGHQLAPKSQRHVV